MTKLVLDWVFTPNRVKRHARWVLLVVGAASLWLSILLVVHRLALIIIGHS